MPRPQSRHTTQEIKALRPKLIDHHQALSEVIILNWLPPSWQILGHKLFGVP